MELFDKLNQKEIPTALRICAGTDGSVTFLLEVMTGKEVKVMTIYQKVEDATPDEARLLGIEAGEPVNHRKVVLTVSDTPYVVARSLAPINSMPAGIRDDLMRVDIPIGRILRKHRLEIRRDILNIELKNGEDIFNDIQVLSREYVIIHDGRILIWINELFPVDDRWKI